MFQIYGLPKNDGAATEAVHNAGELFKLAGNQSPERSTYILTSIVGDFRSGKLGQSDCAEAGAPIPTNSEESPELFESRRRARRQSVTTGARNVRASLSSSKSAPRLALSTIPAR